MNIEHITVYADKDTYAGWPANHGAWQWGDEFLVGFMRGPYLSRRATHNITRPFEKVLARSLDGGETWSVEIPDHDFEAMSINTPPVFDMSQNIIRVCGVYDHGGEECDPRGGFYLSNDRGKSWCGAYSFDGLEPLFDGKERHCTARTCVLDNIIFLSVANRRQWSSDCVFCATHDGEEFHVKSVVCADNIRAVMPAVVRMGDSIIATIRRRGESCFIESFISYDNGHTWRPLSIVGSTGKSNGNPPALIESNGVLFCAYGNRDTKTMMLFRSYDQGLTWKDEVLRSNSKTDIGYPRLFKRQDGNLVCVYYWSDVGVHNPQHIEATIFQP